MTPGTSRFVWHVSGAPSSAMLPLLTGCTVPITGNTSDYRALSSLVPHRFHGITDWRIVRHGHAVLSTFYPTFAGSTLSLWPRFWPFVRLSGVLRLNNESAGLRASLMPPKRRQEHRLLVHLDKRSWMGRRRVANTRLASEQVQGIAFSAIRSSNGRSEHWKCARSKNGRIPNHASTVPSPRSNGPWSQKHC